MHLSGRMPIHNIITPKKLEGSIGDLAGKKYVNMMFFHMDGQPNLAKLNARILGKSKSERQSKTSAST